MQRPVQGNAGTQPAQAPQPNCISRFLSDLRHQLMAQRGTDAGLRVLKVHKETPLLVLELAVDALLLTPRRASVLPIKRMLLAGIDAAYDPTQQRQHSDLTLQVLHQSQAV